MGSWGWSPYDGISALIRRAYSKLVAMVAQMVKRCPQCRRPGFDSWVWKIPWKRKWQSTPALLPGKSHGQRTLIGYSPWGHKESDTTERLHFHFHLQTRRRTLTRHRSFLDFLELWEKNIRCLCPTQPLPVYSTSLQQLELRERIRKIRKAI